MNRHAKQSEAAITPAGGAPSRSPDAANSAIATTATASAAIASPLTAEGARTAALEAIGFWALILVYMWWIEPTAPLPARVACLALLGLMPIVSLLLHRDPPVEIGLGLRGLGRSALEVGAATLACALLIGAIAAATARRPQLGAGALLFFPGYLVWGFLQQLALQGFVHRRLRQGMGRPESAALVTALLFGSVHLPNPVLAPATALAGWIWCRLYTRRPNLWTLAASHALLAGLVLWTIPRGWVHNLRVGPGYWLWH